MSDAICSMNPETGMVEVVVDKEGRIIEGASVTEMRIVDRTRIRRRKDGSFYDIGKRVNEYITKNVAVIKNGLFGGNDVKIDRIENLTLNKEVYKMTFYRGKKEFGKTEMSKKGAWELANSILMDLCEEIDMSSDFDYQDDAKLCTETYVYSALLKSPTYRIIRKDVVNAGANNNTVPNILKNMVKRGILVKVGKIGKSDVYTCRIPKDKLEKMFGRN